MTRLIPILALSAVTIAGAFGSPAYGAAGAPAPQIAAAKKVFAAWSPWGIAYRDGVLSVAIDREQVGQAQFVAMVADGLCAAAAVGHLGDVQELDVLNRTAAQGFAFEGGVNSCDAVNSARGDNYLLGVAVMGAAHAI